MSGPPFIPPWMLPPTAADQARWAEREAARRRAKWGYRFRRAVAAWAIRLFEPKPPEEGE